MASPPPGRCTAGSSFLASQSDSDFTSSSRMNARNVSRSSLPAVPLSQLKIISNLSTHFFHKLEGKFTEEQKELVAGAGFSFVFSYPASYKTDRQFAVWLLSHTNICHDRLRFHGCGYVDVRPADVGDVFGIPGGPKPVKPILELGPGSGEKVRKSEFRFGAISLTASVRKAEGVITRLVGNNQMTEEEKSAFVAAVAIQSVGTFLAPADKNAGEVEECVVQAICGEDSIKSYDWQGYVLERLAQGAAHVRAQIARVVVLVGRSICLAALHSWCRCIGHEFPERVVGTPLISCFTAEVLRMAERGDQERRKTCPSWVVLSCKKKLDCNGFLTIVRKEAMNAGEEVARRAANVIVPEERMQSGAGGMEPGCGAAQTQAAAMMSSISLGKQPVGQSACPLRRPCPIGNVGPSSVNQVEMVTIVRKHFGPMFQKIISEVIWEQGKLTGGGPRPISGNAKLIQRLFSTMEAEMTQCKLDWLSMQAISTGSSGLSPELGQASVMRNTLHERFTSSNDATPERYGTTAKKLYEGTDKSEFSRSKSPGYQQHCPGFNKSNFLGSVIHPTLQNSIDFLTPRTRTHTPQTRNGKEDLPVYDKSGSDQGTGSQYRGLDLLAHAAVTCNLASNKRSLTELLGTDNVNPESDWSGKAARRNCSGSKRTRSWNKPFEQMSEQVFSDASLVFCLMSTLQSEDLLRGNSKRVWVRFDSPVNVEIRGYEIINDFVNGKAFSVTMMAAIIALFKELDDKLHCDDTGPRWRFFVDPRIMAGCVSGDNGYEGGESYALIEKPYLSFEPTECEVGIVPVLVGGSWICFAIHLIEYKITGFQPYSRDALRYIPEEELRKISDRILSRVLTLLGAASGSYYPPLADWSFELFKWGGSPDQSDEEAVLVSMFAIFFDGKDVVREMCKESSTLAFRGPPRKRVDAPFKWHLCSLLLRREENPLSIGDLFA